MKTSKLNKADDRVTENRKSILRKKYSEKFISWKRGLGLITISKH